MCDVSTTIFQHLLLKLYIFMLFLLFTRQKRGYIIAYLWPQGTWTFQCHLAKNRPGVRCTQRGFQSTDNATGWRYWGRFFQPGQAWRWWEWECAPKIHIKFWNIPKSHRALWVHKSHFGWGLSKLVQNGHSARTEWMNCHSFQFQFLWLILEFGPGVDTLSVESLWNPQRRKITQSLSLWQGIPQGMWRYVRYPTKTHIHASFPFSS